MVKRGRSMSGYAAINEAFRYAEKQLARFDADVEIGHDAPVDKQDDNSREITQKAMPLNQD